MKKLICLAVMASILLSSCSSLEPSRAYHGMKVDQSPMVEHINGTIWGIYLLPTIPLIIPYEEGPIDVDTCVNMVTRKAQQLGYTRVCDLQSHSTSTWIFPSFVLWYKEVQVSCNAVK